MPITVTYDDNRNGPLQEIMLLSGWCRVARCEHSITNLQPEADGVGFFKQLISTMMIEINNKK